MFVKEETEDERELKYPPDLAIKEEDPLTRYSNLAIKEEDPDLNPKQNVAFLYRDTSHRNYITPMETRYGERTFKVCAK